MNRTFDPTRPCPACGLVHDCAIQNVVIREDAAQAVPELLRGFSRALIVSDGNTRPLCFDSLSAALESAGVAFDEAFFPQTSIVVPDEASIGFVKSRVTDATQLLIGIGSGVINDLCKHVSHLCGLPYMIFATAPSMDGYASKGSALILNGMKVTLNAAVPRWIVADVRVLAGAPMEMIQAGIGDVVGKYSSLSDWKLGALLNGEVLCPDVYALAMEQTDAVAGCIEGCLRREPAAVRTLMEALVQVGFAMSYMGNSRPASGSEHHLSHFFEIVGLLRGRPYLPHGIDVAYSSLETARLRKRALALDPAAFRHSFDPDAYRSDMRRVFGSLSGEVTALQEKVGFHRRDMHEIIARRWPEIQQILREASDDARQEELLRRAGLDPARFREFYGEDMIHEALVYAKELKDRYTVQWLLDDVGALQDCVE